LAAVEAVEAVVELLFALPFEAAALAELGAPILAFVETTEK
jgi:hypothetical protein